MIDQRNFHQTPEEIIKTATPEQRLMWNHIFMLTGERASISQYFFQGLIAGHEMLTYRARRLYFCLCLEGKGSSVPSVNQVYFHMFDENNVQFFSLINCSHLWNTTTGAVNYLSSNGEAHNIYFSRLNHSGIVYFKFIGYRITY